MPRLLKKYNDEVAPELAKKFGYTNIMSMPRIEKVVVNMGVGKATENRKILEDVVGDLATITGQKPIICLAKKSVAGFKVREGNAVGCKVTLRGKRMWEFLDRVITLAMPRIRDFRGFSEKAFDGRGNYTFGLSEQTVFPEVNIDKVEFIQGMDVTCRITGDSDDASRELLRLLGFPFRRPDDNRV
jgi:large subunit ribosomal protein L5